MRAELNKTVLHHYDIPVVKTVSLTLDDVFYYVEDVTGIPTIRRIAPQMAYVLYWPVMRPVVGSTYKTTTWSSVT